MALRELEEGVRQLQLRNSEIMLQLAQIEPAGMIRAFAGSSAPAGWLICNGGAIVRADYPELFDAIGTTYGAGNGSTTFNIPDGRGRALIGAGTGSAAGATAHALGQLAGAETHTLSTAEMPSHDHALEGHAISWGHGTIGFSTQPQAYAGAPSGNGLGTYQGIDGYKDTYNTGGGGAHNNMQPYLAVNFIIKAS